MLCFKHIYIICSACFIHTTHHNIFGSSSIYLNRVLEDVWRRNSTISKLSNKLLKKTKNNFFSVNFQYFDNIQHEIHAFFSFFHDFLNFCLLFPCSRSLYRHQTYAPNVFVCIECCFLRSNIFSPLLSSTYIACGL